MYPHIRSFTVIPAVFLLLETASAAGSPALRDPVAVRAVDSDGQSIPNFRTRIKYEYQTTAWSETTNGTGYVQWGNLGIGNRGAHVDLVVQAEGFATAIRNLEASVLEAGIDVALQRGRLIQIELDPPEGHPLPASIEPQLFLPRHWKHLWIQLQQGSGLSVERMGYPNPLEESDGGVFTYRVEEGLAAVSFALDDARYLTGAEFGPFALDRFDGGPIKVSLPAPALIRLRLDGLAGDAGPGFRSYTAQLMRIYPDKGGVGIIYGRQDGFGAGSTAEFSGLPPGDYWVEAFVMPEHSETDAPAPFRDLHTVTLEPGDEQELISTFAPYDAQIAQGEHDLTVHVKSTDGSDAGGVHFELRYVDFHYGGGRFGKATANGIIPESGTITVGGLTAKSQTPARLLPHIESELGTGMARANYYLIIDNGRFREHVTLSADTPATEITVVLPPDKGDAAPDITFESMDGGERRRLSAWRGSVVLLEFWATWCGPCQEPMAHNVGLHAEKGESWAGKAVILPLSVDDSVERLRDHVLTKGWETLDHYWVGDAGAGFQSSAARAFGITGVPTAFLIDGEGTIQWRGHPHEIDIESEMIKLIEE